jgi:hypothetical protein
MGVKRYMDKIKEAKAGWKRKCKVCNEVNSAWVEIMVKTEGPDNHIICKECIHKVLTLEYWGIKIHRIADKQRFSTWIIDGIENGQEKLIVK